MGNEKNGDKQVPDKKASPIAPERFITATDGKSSRLEETKER